MALFKILKGKKENLPVSQKEGYCYFTEDEAKLYVDTANGRVVLNAENAEKDSNGNNIADTYMTKVNPTGSGSVSIGRKAGSTVGTNSIAIGSDAEATMECSIALGYQTVAKGDGATAIGSFSQASGDAAFAEGWETSASYRGAHAEGIGTYVKGQGAHAEGRYTKALAATQHVQGKYNIEDSNSVYADIVGNGTSDTSRSNAYTLDWDGNGWFSGDVYVGSTSGSNKDDGSKKLATETYVDTAISQIDLTVDKYPTSGSTNLVQSGGVFEDINKKMTKTDPIGTGTFSLNRKPGTIEGDYSFAEGYNTTASNYYSHAEGNYTVASHAASHAEGEYTVASGYVSHAEGDSTIAASRYQHVQGRYNVEDADDVYLHIVGNGEEENSRSNAHTLDWSGNAWFAGNVYVGGDSKNEGSVKLATINDISDTKVTTTANTSTTQLYVTGCTGTMTAPLSYNSNVYINCASGVLFGAAWNDYAEYRIADYDEPGRVICENGDDTLSLATERLQPGGSVISDTFGFAIGETDLAKTPIAVSGRVLVYPYEDRKSYMPGDAVCAAPNGTVSKMTRKEIREYPERIIGTVSAIPEYETWGTGNVPVNGRIWIKVR